MSDIIRYFSDIDEEELNTNYVFLFRNSEEYYSILIKSENLKEICSSKQTDSLIFKPNGEYSRRDTIYYFHEIVLKKDDEYSLQQFKVVYNYLFKKINKKVSAKEIDNLFLSLEDLFKVSKDNNKETQVGIYGELLFLYTLYNLGCKNIFSFYHPSFYFKHDIELNETNRIEIKTTLKEKRIHHFKHNQLVASNLNVYVASLMLEECKVGLTLFDLFSLIFKLDISEEDKFNVYRLMSKFNISKNDVGVIIKENVTTDFLKIYDVKNVPKLSLKENETDGISNISYDVDLSNCENLSIIDFVALINKNF